VKLGAVLSLAADFSIFVGILLGQLWLFDVGFGHGPAVVGGVPARQVLQLLLLLAAVLVQGVVATAQGVTPHLQHHPIFKLLVL
jgi:hypothetical protein